MPVDYANMVRQIMLKATPVADKMNPLHEGLSSPVSGLEGARTGGTGGGVRLYHGTGYGSDFLGPQVPQAKFRLPTKSESSEPGVFMTPDPMTAARYGDSVIPLDVNLKNVATLDWKKVQAKYNLPDERYRSRYVTKAIEAANKHGKDFLVIKNMYDIGGSHDQVVALKPSGKVKNAITGEAMLGTLLALGLGDRQEPPPPR